MWKAMLAAAVAGLIGFIVYAYSTQANDRDQILAAVAESAKAARDGRSNPVMDNLSKNLNFNSDANPDRNEISKMIRQSHPDFTVLNTDPKVDGDHATLSGPVKVDVTYLGFDLHNTLPSVTLKFTKESGTIYGFLPAAKWRIVGVESEGLPGL